MPYLTWTCSPPLSLSSAPFRAPGPAGSGVERGGVEWAPGMLGLLRKQRERGRAQNADQDKGGRQRIPRECARRARVVLSEDGLAQPRRVWLRREYGESI